MLFFALLAFAAATPPSAAAVPTAAMRPATAVEPRKHFALIEPATVQPRLMVAAPAPRGSATEAFELDVVRRTIAAASPERLAQARWDGEHEDPSVFDAVVGRRLADLPATWALLRMVQNETDAAVDLGKTYFARTRPYGVDPSLPYCDSGKGKKPTRSYPSGHSGLGYSVGWTLAQLMPDKAPAILARAQDYALRPGHLRNALPVGHRGEPRHRNGDRGAAARRQPPCRPDRRGAGGTRHALGPAVGHGRADEARLPRSDERA